MHKRFCLNVTLAFPVPLHLKNVKHNWEKTKQQQKKKLINCDINLLFCVTFNNKIYLKDFFSEVSLKAMIFFDNNNTWKSIAKKNNNKKLLTFVSRKTPKGKMMNRLWKHFTLTLMSLYNMSYRRESGVFCLVSFSYNYYLSLTKDRDIRCL